MTLHQKSGTPHRWSWMSACRNYGTIFLMVLLFSFLFPSIVQAEEEPFIRLISPEPETIFTPGEEITVRWEQYGLKRLSSVSLLYESTMHWRELSNLPASDGVHELTIPVGAFRCHPYGPLRFSFHGSPRDEFSTNRGVVYNSPAHFYSWENGDLTSPDIHVDIIEPLEKENMLFGSGEVIRVRVRHQNVEYFHIGWGSGAPSVSVPKDQVVEIAPGVVELTLEVPRSTGYRSDTHYPITVRGRAMKPVPCPSSPYPLREYVTHSDTTEVTVYIDPIPSIGITTEFKGARPEIGYMHHDTGQTLDFFEGEDTIHLDWSQQGPIERVSIGIYTIVDRDNPDFLKIIADNLIPNHPEGKKYPTGGSYDWTIPKGFFDYLPEGRYYFGAEERRMGFKIFGYDKNGVQIAEGHARGGLEIWRNRGDHIITDGEPEYFKKRRAQEAQQNRWEQEEQERLRKIEEERLREEAYAIEKRARLAREAQERLEQEQEDRRKQEAAAERKRKAAELKEKTTRFVKKIFQKEEPKQISLPEEDKAILPAPEPPVTVKKDTQEHINQDEDIPADDQPDPVPVVVAPTPRTVPGPPASVVVVDTPSDFANATLDKEKDVVEENEVSSEPAVSVVSAEEGVQEDRSDFAQATSDEAVQEESASKRITRIITQVVRGSFSWVRRLFGR